MLNNVPAMLDTMTSLDDPSWVHNRIDLAAYVAQLSRAAAIESDDWENPSLDRYLEALSAFIDGMDSDFINRGEPVPDEPNWAMIAKMLRAACFYE
jgi:hypothetical protein